MLASRHTLFALSALLALGCGDKKAEVQDGSLCTEIHKEVPVASSRDLDLLIVVDNSASMSDEAEALELALRYFANVLENIEGRLPNLQIAIVSSSSDLSTLGKFVTQAGGSPCLNDGSAFLVDKVFANGEREKNYSASLGDTLVCMAALPPAGQAIEQPLEAMRRALDGTHTGNAGFLRESAFLFAILLGDEDDCSGGSALRAGTSEGNSAWQCFADSIQCDQAVDTYGTKTGCQLVAPNSLTAVSEYVEFLRGTKPDPAMVLVSALHSTGEFEVIDSPAGPSLRSTCTGSRSASPSLRIPQFLQGFPNRNTGTDVCQEDWSDAVLLIADLSSSVLASPCIYGPVDLDSETPGVQHDCVVAQVLNFGTDQQQETPLAECSSTNPEQNERPCWLISEDPLFCPDQDSYAFEVLRGRETLPPRLTISIRCHGGCVAR